MIQAVIFDFDGTIFDSDAMHSKAYAQIISEYGKTPLLNEGGVVHHVGRKAHDNWTLLKEKYAIEETIDILARKKRNAYETLLSNTHITPMKGLLPLLELLQKNHIKTAIASNAPFTPIKLVLKSVGIFERFHPIVSIDDVEKPKPFPDVYLKALSLLNLSAADGIAIEDSEAGVTSAKAAGLKAIAVPTKYTKVHDHTHADKILSSLEDVDLTMLQNI